MTEHISELHVKIARYRQLKIEADKLEEEIKGSVLELGKTVKGHNIEVQYKKGRKTYDYENAGKLYAPELVISNHTYPKTDWRAVCKATVDPDNIECTVGRPTVAIKITDDEIPEFPM